ncbi:threonine-phosphate decarboxylase CobD [Rhodocyclus tenuis]|uniref:threonine-phosphate decarboxylase n=1 Tax=Rhodocyclus tenuis TaxID=1066 RepID=A0A840G7D0_RHOTE|nr:threonine-phosphate decarboxylase CobD [Rhodocyclus tenuis]MBB4246618.1 cobalamin biosynthetic protein CobC [Rhodocyclus tenuis]
MLEHGGRLRQAAAHYGIPLADWLDLSTGINPLGWPVPPLPAACWQRLPEDDDSLEQIAAAAYGHPAPLPLPGSQAAIQTLPYLLPTGPVAVLAPCYAEHAHAFAIAGRVPQRFAAEQLEDLAARARVVVLANPNNPDGEVFTPQRLAAAAARLAAHGGWLVVDEAFGDATPELSLTGSVDALPRTLPENIIVLRSLGKFYGLAGARVGFALAPPALRSALRERIGPWPVSGPARLAAAGALADRDWQVATRARLARDSARLAALLAPFGAVRRTALFCWLPLAEAPALHAALARRGILTRRFDDPCGLRFGLPGVEAEWQRLAAALAAIAKESVMENMKEQGA